MVNKPYKTTYTRKFLWFPKRVSGQWLWLKTVTKKVEEYTISIDGYVENYKKVTWLGVGEHGR